MNLKKLLPFLLLIPLLIPTLVPNEYYVHGILCRILIYSMVVCSLDLIVGYIGDVSIGHAALFAIGAYTVAILTASPDVNSDAAITWFPQVPFFVALVPAVLLSAFAGFVLAYPSLRTSGPYLAIITIAYGLIVYTFINEQENWTNGTRGITVHPLEIAGVKFNNNNYFYILYIALVLVMFLVNNVAKSFWGRAFEAIKYSSIAAECSGISKSYYKIIGFVLSAAISGLAGGFFLQLDSYVAPNTFSYNFSVELLIALILGGVRSVWGNLIGVTMLILLPEVFTFMSDYRLMIFGSILILLLYFLPEGLAGVIKNWWQKRNATDLNETLKQELAPHSLSESQLADTTFIRKEILQTPEQAHSDIALQTKDLTMRFGGLTAVDGLSINIKRGTVHGLIGPNGSGKSTTVNMLTGVYQPTFGSVTMFGDDLLKKETFQRSKGGIARTFQNLQLFADLTVLENVMVGLHQSFKSSMLASAFRLPSAQKEETTAKIRAYRLLQFVGIEELAFEQAKNLSYGKARLLEIARALAASPQLLLLDEPAAGLTSGEIEEMSHIIEKIKACGLSILLIEHHMDMVMSISDEVTVLDFGKKIAEGTPYEVQTNPRVITAYLGMG
jgi:branched-chain amino acid transport system permease protein